MSYLKCVLLGENGCGKTTLINTFMKGYFEKNINQTEQNIRYNVNFVHKNESLTHESYYFQIYDYSLNEKNPEIDQKLNDIGSEYELFKLNY